MELWGLAGQALKSSRNRKTGSMLEILNTFGGMGFLVFM